jgi:hypothetical protein
VPSSLIFASLVVLWLLILVPAVARRRQEVARPSVAALSGRVLERPLQHQGPATCREREVDVMDDEVEVEPRGRTTGPDRAEDDSRWERPAPRYRPGRGGFDPEAAAVAARARYAFRQRVVLTMLVLALVTGVVAAVSLPWLWWAHAAVDASLVGYLAYLRRQVRLEEAIRERRAARMAGTRRTAAAEDPDLDAWARRGRELTCRDGDEPYTDEQEADLDDLDDDLDRVDALDDVDEADELHRWDDAYEDDERDDEPLDDEAERVPETREPTPSARRRNDPDPEPEPALPRLRPAPPPALPAGTSLVEVDEDDPDLYDLDGPTRVDYRRAAGE